MKTSKMLGYIGADSTGRRFQLISSAMKGSNLQIAVIDATGKAHIDRFEMTIDYFKKIGVWTVRKASLHEIIATVWKYR